MLSLQIWLYQYNLTLFYSKILRAIQSCDHEKMGPELKKNVLQPAPLL